jgi:hypothetical protein
MKYLRNKFIAVTIFAIAMGFLESSVVVYLREILYPEGFDFPLKPISPRLAITELLREAATLIMLVSVGIFLGRRFSTGFAWFLFCFAIWDIFYYVFLWLLLGWPESLMTWDVLFLIPTTWTGPVLTPVLVSLVMILFAVFILKKEEKGTSSRILPAQWGLLILGSLVLIWSWIMDYTRHMLQQLSLGEMMKVDDPRVMEVAMQYVPGRFPWLLYFAGLSLILAGISLYAFGKRKPVMDH